MTRPAHGTTLTLIIGETPFPCSGDARFTTDVSGATIHDALDAAKLCKTCPIRTQCLAFHSSDRNFHGVAGGLLWPAHPVCRTSGATTSRSHNPHCASCTGHRPHPAQAKNGRANSPETGKEAA